MMGRSSLLSGCLSLTQGPGQRGCGCPIPSNIQGQVGQGPQQPETLLSLEPDHLEVSSQAKPFKDFIILPSPSLTAQQP